MLTACKQSYRLYPIIANIYIPYSHYIIVNAIDYASIKTKYCVSTAVTPSLELVICKRTTKTLMQCYKEGLSISLLILVNTFAKPTEVFSWFSPALMAEV